MNIPEKYLDRPNLWRVACGIAKMDHPDRVVDALYQVLANHTGKKLPTPLPVPEGQTPRAVYDALAAFADAGKEAAV